MANSLIQVRIDEKLKLVNGLPFDLRNSDRNNPISRWKVYDDARKMIQDNNVPEMSLEEINEEIRATREMEESSKS